MAINEYFIINDENTLLASIASGRLREKLTIPDGVKRIGHDAFEYCDKMIEVIIPDGVISIDERAFNQCYRLESITIADTVSSIDVDAFCGCKKLTTVNYTGSKHQWSKIIIKGGNRCLMKANKNFNYKDDSSTTSFDDKNEQSPTYVQTKTIIGGNTNEIDYWTNNWIIDAQKKGYKIINISGYYCSDTYQHVRCITYESSQVLFDIK